MSDHEEEATGGMKYPHNALEGFSNGCIMDLRMRFAMEYLKSGAIEPATPSIDAEYALELAERFFINAEERGWVSPLTDNGELNRALRMQARRSAKFQAMQQIEAQRTMQEVNNPNSPQVVIEPTETH